MTLPNSHSSFQNTNCNLSFWDNKDLKWWNVCTACELNNRVINCQMSNLINFIDILFETMLLWSSGLWVDHISFTTSTSSFIIYRQNIYVASAQMSLKRPTTTQFRWNHTLFCTMKQIHSSIMSIFIIISHFLLLLSLTPLSLNDKWQFHVVNAVCKMGKSSYHDCFNQIGFKLVKSLDNLSLHFWIHVHFHDFFSS